MRNLASLLKIYTIEVISYKSYYSLSVDYEKDSLSFLIVTLCSFWKLVSVSTGNIYGEAVKVWGDNLMLLDLS